MLLVSAVDLPEKCMSGIRTYRPRDQERRTPKSPSGARVRRASCLVIPFALFLLLLIFAKTTLSETPSKTLHAMVANELFSDARPGEAWAYRDLDFCRVRRSLGFNDSTDAGQSHSLAMGRMANTRRELADDFFGSVLPSLAHRFQHLHNESGRLVCRTHCSEACERRFASAVRSGARVTYLLGGMPGMDHTGTRPRKGSPVGFVTKEGIVHLYNHLAVDVYYEHVQSIEIEAGEDHSLGVRGILDRGNPWEEEDLVQAEEEDEDYEDDDFARAELGFEKGGKKGSDADAEWWKRWMCSVRKLVKELTLPPRDGDEFSPSFSHVHVEPVAGVRILGFETRGISSLPLFGHRSSESTSKRRDKKGGNDTTIALELEWRLSTRWIQVERPGRRDDYYAKLSDFREGMRRMAWLEQRTREVCSVLFFLSLLVLGWIFVRTSEEVRRVEKALRAWAEGFESCRSRFENEFAHLARKALSTNEDDESLHPTGPDGVEECPGSGHKILALLEEPFTAPVLAVVSNHTPQTMSPHEASTRHRSVPSFSSSSSSSSTLRHQGDWSRTSRDTESFGDFALSPAESSHSRDSIMTAYRDEDLVSVSSASSVSDGGRCGDSSVPTKCGMTLEDFYRWTAVCDDLSRDLPSLPWLLPVLFAAGAQVCVVAFLVTLMGTAGISPTSLAISELLIVELGAVVAGYALCYAHRILDPDQATLGGGRIILRSTLSACMFPILCLLLYVTDRFERRGFDLIEFSESPMVLVLLYFCSFLTSEVLFRVVGYLMQLRQKYYGMRRNPRCIMSKELEGITDPLLREARRVIRDTNDASGRWEWLRIGLWRMFLACAVTAPLTPAVHRFLLEIDLVVYYPDESRPIPWNALSLSYAILASLLLAFLASGSMVFRVMRAGRSDWWWQSLRLGFVCAFQVTLHATLYQALFHHDRDVSSHLLFFVRLLFFAISYVFAVSTAGFLGAYRTVRAVTKLNKDD